MTQSPISTDSWPDFCTLPVLLQVFFWGQIGSLVYVLGHGLPLHWSLAGLVSIYSGWVSLIIVFVWCLLSGLFQRRMTVADELAVKLFWMLLWLAAILTAALLAKLVFMLGSSRFLPLLPATASQWSFLFSSVLISAVLTGSLLRYLFIQNRWRAQQQQQARAELRNLQSRVQPHFLFNTMNTIAALVEQQPEHAVAAIEDLSDLLRQSLAPRSRLISLADELTLARRYLRLMQWRLGERLQLDWQIEPGLEQDPRWQLPPLSLQVLLENAVLHGIQPSLAGGTIQVLAQIEGQRLRISINNPIAPQQRPDRHSAPNGTGTAISDLRRRLQLLFEREVQLHTSITAQRFTAQLLLPATRPLDTPA